jgi:hypothetical protein
MIPKSGYPRAHILKSGSEISGSPYTMAAVDNASVTDWRRYTLTKAGLLPGTDYTYRFEAQDTSGRVATGTPTAAVAGPAVAPPPPTGAVFRVESGSGNVLADGPFYGAAFLGGAADIAEWVPLNETVEAGTVLELDTSHPGWYRLSQESCSPLVAGVVSSEPGVMLGGTEPAEGKALLALSGIVPVKVTDEGGPIQPGDLLVSSSTPGYAMRWAEPEPCPCALVGKALQPMTDDSGMILVLLTAH